MFQFDLAIFFDMRSAPHDFFFFARIELKHVALPVENDLPITPCLSIIYQNRKITPLQLMRSFRASKKISLKF